ncbi:MAG: hypothetical protein Q9221_003240 [Calogaya cf. arnoldii]
MAGPECSATMKSCSNPACRTRPSLNVSNLGLNIQAFSHEERSLESLHTLLTQQIDKASSTPNQQSNAFVTGMRSLATLRDEWELEMMLRRKILQSIPNDPTRPPLDISNLGPEFNTFAKSADAFTDLYQLLQQRLRKAESLAFDVEAKPNSQTKPNSNTNPDLDAFMTEVRNLMGAWENWVEPMKERLTELRDAHSRQRVNEMMKKFREGDVAERRRLVREWRPRLERSGLGDE